MAEDRLSSLNGYAISDLQPHIEMFAALLRRHPASIVTALADFFEDDADEKRFLKTAGDELQWSVDGTPDIQGPRLDSRFQFRGYDAERVEKSLLDVASAVSLDVLSVADIVGGEDATATRWLTSVANSNHAYGTSVGDIYEAITCDFADGALPADGDWLEDHVYRMRLDSALRYCGSAMTWSEAHEIAANHGVEKMVFRGTSSEVQKGAVYVVHPQERDDTDDRRELRDAFAAILSITERRAVANVAHAMHVASLRSAEMGSDARIEAALEAGERALANAVPPVHPILVEAAMQLHPNSKFGSHERQAVKTLARNAVADRPLGHDEPAAFVIGHHLARHSETARNQIGMER